MRVPDRQKQRREYLGRKAGACLGEGMAVAFLLFFLLLTAGCGIFTCLSLFIPGLQPAILPFGFLTFFLGVGSRAIYMVTQQADQHVKSISYIPPVTLNTLPAEEVLVRGSQEPTQEQSGVLLRAAGESADTPSEQLLRASVGKNE